METIGTLAGGIAHDFNNTISTMLGNAELARRQLDREHAAAAEHRRDHEGEPASWCSRF